MNSGYISVELLNFNDLFVYSNDLICVKCAIQALVVFDNSVHNLPYYIHSVLIEQSITKVQLSIPCTITALMPLQTTYCL